MFFGNRKKKAQMERLRQVSYRVATDTRSCASCAHMEVLDAGPNRGKCLCRPLDYFFSNTTQNRGCVCDTYMAGSQMDGLIQELADLIIASHQKDGSS